MIADFDLLYGIRTTYRPCSDTSYNILLFLSIKPAHLHAGGHTFDSRLPADRVVILLAKMTILLYSGVAAHKAAVL